MQPDKRTLERLYVVERLTTREIGRQFGVSKTSVLRWLRLAEIETRAANCGTENRGIIQPTATELFNMVHVEHLTYDAIAQKFGVDKSSITNWLRKHSIKTPSIWDTRYAGKPPKITDETRLIELYKQGASTVQLAGIFNVSAQYIRKRLRVNEVEVRAGGFKGKRFTCNDGHIVMSIYEQRVDNWLNFHGFAHDIEPRLPFSNRSRADFLVGDTYIEIWGVVGSAIYTERRKRKTEQYRKNGLKLIELQAHDFDVQRRKTFDKILAKALLE